MKNFDEYYHDILDSSPVIPPVWSALYKLCSCLKDSEKKQTYLIQECQSLQYFILKVATDNEALLLQEEAHIYQLLFEKSSETPDCSKCLEWNQKYYYLRPYVEGNSLASLVSISGLSYDDTVQLGIAICAEVQKLHQMQPPIIHRDIKPENIIRCPNGSICLIDFETARQYDKDKASDTCFIGTRETAAPEQYGFSQSDVRTDIYGIGKTLQYLYTGGYESDYTITAKCKASNNLEKIIQKCCAFDPANRYADVSQLSGELVRLRSTKQRNALYFPSKFLYGIIIFLIVLIVCLSLKMVELNRRLGQTSDSATPQQADSLNEHITESDTSNAKLPILLMGFNMTDYEPMLYSILEQCMNREYDGMTKECVVLLNALYKDEFLLQVESMDTYGMNLENPEWNEYQIQRLGYEKIADRLAYHNRFLYQKKDQLDIYSSYIGVVVRGSLESTVVNTDGTVTYSLLHEFYETGNTEALDYCMDDFLGLILSAIDLYDQEN